MENYEQQFTPEQLQKLMRLFQQQQQESGDLSSDSEIESIVDINGVKKTRSEIVSQVSLGDDYVPQISREKISYRLDCGHPQVNLSKTQSCDFGHTLCLDHDLIPCSRCRGVMCFKDVYRLYEYRINNEEVYDSKPICKKCKSLYWRKLFYFGGIILLIILTLGIFVL